MTNFVSQLPAIARLEKETRLPGGDEIAVPRDVADDDRDACRHHFHDASADDSQGQSYPKSRKSRPPPGWRCRGPRLDYFPEKNRLSSPDSGRQIRTFFSFPGTSPGPTQKSTEMHVAPRK